MKILLLAIGLFSAANSFAQLYMTRSGTISFHSHTWLENIDAVNDKVMAVIDVGKKNIAFTLLLKEFSFERKLMQEHFNENYVESDKFPKSTFSGLYTGDLDPSKDGTYPLKIKGKLTLHGVTKDIDIPANVVVKSGMLGGTSSFKLNPADFDIDIPFIVRDKIEKENTVKVKVDWLPK